MDVEARAAIAMLARHVAGLAIMVQSRSQFDDQSFVGLTRKLQELCEQIEPSSTERDQT